MRILEGKSCACGRSFLFSGGVALRGKLFHYGLNELLGSIDFAEDGFEIERGLRGVALRGAVDSVLADEDEGVSEHVERDGEFAARRPHHEFVSFKFVAAVVKAGHSATTLSLAYRSQRRWRLEELSSEGSACVRRWSRRGARCVWSVAQR